MQARSPRQRRARRAGFTLVELMTVVAIVGILAVLAVAALGGHLRAAKANQAILGLQAIRVAEEANRAQTGEYRDCSKTTNAYFPNPTPDSKFWDWRQTSNPDWPCWQTLGVPRNGGTRYSYRAYAGRPGDAYPTAVLTNPPTLPNPARDLWYVIEVQGNVDEDTVLMNGIITSISGEVYLENDGE